MYDAPGELWRGHARSIRRGDVRKGRDLNLLATANLLKTSRNIFSHKSLESRRDVATAPVTQLLCVTATMRTFLFSQTRTQFDAVSNSAFVGESAATDALVNFTPRGCST